MSKIHLFPIALILALQAHAAVTLTPTPATLTFTGQSGSTSIPAAQTVSVKASSGTPTFTATATVPWLTVSPNAGTLPATLTVHVYPYTLPVGSYPGTVTVATPGGGPSVNIAVTLDVTAPPATLGLNPTTLAFTGPPTPAAQNVTLTTDSLPISFDATSGATWLKLNLGNGAQKEVTGVVLSPANPVTMALSVDLTGLTPQAAPYVGKITVVASGAPVKTKSQTITVNLTVNSSTPTVTGVFPSTLPVGGPAATIVIEGTNFYSASVAKIQGVATPLVTTSDKNNSTILTAIVPASLQAVAATLTVIVSNPAPGGDSVPGAGANITVGNTPTILTNGVVSAASYASDAVSPGELVTIFGTNIGPATPAPLSVTAGYVDTTLSGVTATVDGQNAPLIYVSQNQVTLQVPYEATTGTNKNVAVTNGTNPAATAKVKINATAPGIFTADGSGSGQAAAVNVSVAGAYTLNNGTSPAKIGETVILYLTGEGNYNATPLSGVSGASNTGYIIPGTLSPLPQMSPLPSVTIGGVDASAGVTYAGPIVGSILGLLQINVTVPVGAATGAAVPVSVSIGGVNTQVNQPNVTIAIHP